MSLILEALKKLDREKQAPDRGFVVLGHASWPSRGRSGLGLALALLAVGLLAGVAVTAWGRRNSAPSVPPTTVAAASAPAEALVPAPGEGPTPRALDALPVAPRPLPPSGPAEAATDAAPSPPPEYHLQAISLRDGRPVAVLNDRMVFEGDSFDGVRILRIGEAEVEIEVNGRRRVIGF